jgi:hypothetical protein
MDHPVTEQNSAILKIDLLRGDRIRCFDFGPCVQNEGVSEVRRILPAIERGDVRAVDEWTRI